MSNLHACADDGTILPRLPAQRLAGAIETLRMTATRMVSGLVRAVQDLRTPSRISRYSDHLLRDIGFERDWDGSILPRWTSQDEVRR
jgi:hypothetical protein